MVVTRIGFRRNVIWLDTIDFASVEEAQMYAAIMLNREGDCLHFVDDLPGNLDRAFRQTQIRTALVNGLTYLTDIG